MSDDVQNTDSAPAKRAKSGWRWPRRLLGAVLAVLALLVAAAVLLDTSPGHRFLIGQIERQQFESGLRIEIGEIDGSIYGNSVLRNVRFYDVEGRFFETPEIALDWRPLKWFANTLDIRSLIIKQGRLLAVPNFKPSDSDNPILPGFDISIGAFEARNLTIEKQVAGRQQTGTVTGSALVRSGVAKVNMLAELRDGEDRIRLLVDAEPDANRFDIEADINAPAGGVIAALADLDDSYSARLNGDGNWENWNGRARIDRNDTLFSAFNITTQEGNTRILGQALPGNMLTGLAGKLAGQKISFDARGSLDRRILDGSLLMRTDTLVLNGVGAVDLGNNAFDDVAIDARFRNTDFLGGDVNAEKMMLRAILDDSFRNLSAQYRLNADNFRIDDYVIAQPVATGTAQWNGNVARIPVKLTTSGVAAKDEFVTRLLKGLSGQGDLVYRSGQLTSENIRIAAEGVTADFKLDGQTKRDVYVLNGTADFPAIEIKNIGIARIDSRLRVAFGGRQPWTVKGTAAGQLRNVTNRTLTSIAGDNIRFSSDFSVGRGLPLLLTKASLNASLLSATGDGRRLADGRIILDAKGSHAEYGAFDLAFDGSQDGGNATLLLDNPVPSLGLANVRLAIAPISEGFEIDATGDSTLGPFGGLARIFAQPNGNTLIRIRDLKLSNTFLNGDLIADGTDLSGRLSAKGGGLNGFLRVSPQGEGQRIIADLNMDNARFEGAVPIVVNRGQLDVTAILVTGRSDIDATFSAQGISRGALFIGKVAANAKLTNGKGRVTASLAGRRGSRFELQTAANVSPNTLRFTARGNYAGRRISMPSNALLQRLKAGGWRLSPARFDIGSGSTVLSGRFGGPQTDLKFQMSKMPLALADIGYADLGLGGTASGLVNYAKRPGQAPTGTAKLQIRQLTRSGLVLTSRPVDVAVNAALGANALSLRGLVKDKQNTLGRIQARVNAMPANGDLLARLERGNLFGQMRYSGPSDALWRLIGVEIFDLTGPVRIAADVTGNLRNPQLRGSVATDNIRLETGVSGTVVDSIKARGTFAGSRLTLRGFTGTVKGGGSVAGRGTVDLGGDTGVAINLSLRAKNAQLLLRDDIAATVTGPLTVFSTGRGGTLGGNVTIDKGRFKLGNAAEEMRLPSVSFREINRRADELPARRAKVPWRYDITAKGRNRITVTGLGLDSEWGADIAIGGTVDAPQIQGSADLVRGDYEFAGRRFELERGQIVFRGSSPPDPRLDIEAAANVSGLSATILVQGTGLKPEITFASVPALPEEELLSRLLFGSSITDISAPEAVQLAAAVASLRTGGGLDPINQLRSAIGLDRLRIIGADAATGQRTSIAAGKYITRRTYVEVVTDGRGYSATQVEFEITRWLSILSSISTLGRQSANIRISKDY